MQDTEAVQAIGEIVCEGCGPYRDCGLEVDDCDRIDDALGVLYQWFDEKGVL